MSERIEWLGLSAVYAPDELLAMADLKAGFRAGEIDQRELEVIHELKSELGARLVEWHPPTDEAEAAAVIASLNAHLDRKEPQNEERAPQRRRRRHEAQDGQGSFLR